VSEPPSPWCYARAVRRPQISVIGSGSGPEWRMALARELGEAIVDRGWRVVCGGLLGVMQAVAEGARRSVEASGADVIGVLPSFEATSANPFVDIVIPTGMAIARNAIVVGAADVVVAVGGGAGTLSELAMAWQLDKPIVALADSGGWATQLAGDAVDPRRSDRVHAASDVAAAIELIAGLLAEDPHCAALRAQLK
jgi:uncharacterized protein (TIGR00725 family)